ncbi:hypothetical protein [Magnetospirillum sulfuroxidans]|uniref:SPOR domain-containing protein n=1 Tax=Magnetospirillum sulfuroxidans TaxID=611300 RepID=A0ABS5IFN0_9PROT|nr:hypothetical protein [Magnetospirillum sulfuroxidans]MBR9973228.1 hypothetical protein [Magnetospirillum sulfuroxidans]
MNPIAALCAASTVLALAACASEPQPMMTAQVKRAVTPPGGQWEVTDATAIEPAGTDTSPYLGQKMALYEASAGDPAGRSCAKPVYMGWEGSAASVVGTAAPAGDATSPVMEVTCDGQPFGTYVGLADGSLMTRINTWALTLKRVSAEAMVKTPEPAPMPMAEPMKSDGPKTEKVMPEPAKAMEPNKGSIVYLASYKTEKSAHSGWKVLAKKSPILAKQQPVITPVDLGKKGKWIRLYGLAADETERGVICKQLGKLVDECGSRLRE